MIGAVTTANSYVPLAKALDRAASATGVNFVGGFSALVQKGFAKGDEILINSIPEALAETGLLVSQRRIHQGGRQSGCCRPDGAYHQADRRADQG